MILPMKNKHLPSGIEVDWTVTPQLVGIPKRLFLEHDTACLCEILDIRVGQNSYFDSPGEATAIYFHKDLKIPKPISLNLPIVDRQSILVRIRNRSAVATQISGFWEYETDDDKVREEVLRRQEMRVNPFERDVVNCLDKIATTLKVMATALKSQRGSGTIL